MKPARYRLLESFESRSFLSCTVSGIGAVNSYHTSLSGALPSGPSSRTMLRLSAATMAADGCGWPLSARRLDRLLPCFARAPTAKSSRRYKRPSCDPSGPTWLLTGFRMAPPRLRVFTNETANRVTELRPSSDGPPGDPGGTPTNPLQAPAVEDVNRGGGIGDCARGRWLRRKEPAAGAMKRGPFDTTLIGRRWRMWLVRLARRFGLTPSEVRGDQDGAPVTSSGAKTHRTGSAAILLLHGIVGRASSGPVLR